MAAARGSTHETTAAPSTLGSSATLQRPLTGTMGMFIVDTFAYIDPITGENLGDKARGEQLGGGGLYFAIGARMWLPPGDVLMVIDRGTDFHPAWQNTLDHYAFPCPASSRYRHDRPADSSCQAMWRWRDRTDARTTKAVNVYKGEQRGYVSVRRRAFRVGSECSVGPLTYACTASTTSRPSCVSSPTTSHVELLRDFHDGFTASAPPIECEPS